MTTLRFERFQVRKPSELRVGSPRGALHLDDVGSRLGQQECGDGAGHRLGTVDDPEPVEDPRRVRLRPVGIVRRPAPILICPRAIPPFRCGVSLAPASLSLPCATQGCAGRGSPPVCVTFGVTPAGPNVGSFGADAKIGGTAMEDRTTPVLYLEMTDRPADDYAAERVPEVLGLPGVQRATWWDNCVPFRTDLPRTLPEFSILGVYEASEDFVAPGAVPEDIAGLLLRPLPTTGPGNDLGQADPRSRAGTDQCTDSSAEPGASRLGRLRAHPRHRGGRPRPLHHDHAVREQSGGLAPLHALLRARHR